MEEKTGLKKNERYTNIKRKIQQSKNKIGRGSQILDETNIFTKSLLDSLCCKK